MLRPNIQKVVEKYFYIYQKSSSGLAKNVGKHLKKTWANLNLNLLTFYMKFARVLSEIKFPRYR